MNLSGHDAAAARLKRSRHGRVISRCDTDKILKPDTSRGHRADFEILHRESDVLMVEPDAIEPALDAEDLQEVVVHQSPDTDHSDELIVGKFLFNTQHVDSR